MSRPPSKPRAKQFPGNIPCNAWRCNGQKDGKYHAAFAATWWDACKRWHETNPGDLNDRPF